MGKIKGCANESCTAQKKKIKYNESETFCSKCGSLLIYVCKDCYKPLPKDTEKYCVRCRAKHEDKKDKNRKVGVGVFGIGTSALAIYGVIRTYGKKAFDVVKIIGGFFR